MAWMNMALAAEKAEVEARNVRREQADGDG